MSIAIVTGSAGLIGASAASFLAKQGMDVVGIDNDMRKYFFGNEASTRWNKKLLERSLKNYDHVESDIRNQNAVEALFQGHGNRFALVSCSRPALT
jgi:CDP-paratose 2-epimerase